jgi:DNA primase
VIRNLGSDAWRRDLAPGDVEAALDKLGLVFKVRGNEASALCPFHSESSPSWGINLDTGLYYCFSCHASGNFQMLVRHLKSMTPEQSFAWVVAQGPRLGPRTERKKIKKSDDTRDEMNEAKLALTVRPPRWALRARGLDASSAAEFGVRWNPDNQSWICPVRDPKTGKLWGWQEKSERGRYFRNFPEDVRKSRTLFGLDCFEGSAARLVESPLDAVRLRTVGLSGALSSYGSGVSARQLVLLAGVADRVVLCLDDDGAGIARTEHIIKTFRALPVSVFRYRDGDGKDPGDMTGEAIRWADAHAIPSWRY